MNFKVYARYEDYSDRLALYIFRERPDGGREFCTDFAAQTYEPFNDALIGSPTLTFAGRVSKPLLQAIVDEAKTIGITPTGIPVVENELTATKYHLEDMRSLVFGKIKK